MFKLFCLAGSIVLVASCANIKPESQLSPSKEPSLDDYWSMKRSHPTLGFDQKAYKQGMNSIEDLKNQKSAGPATNLTWQQEGPYKIGGRVNVITPIHPTSDTIFAGTANGGVFRTTDGGTNWTPLFDDIAEKAIGAIAIHPNDPNTVFVGTGDRKFGGGSYNGNGVYKSTDLGNSWTNIGLNNVGIISTCIVNAQNPNEIVVGALGSGFAKTTERGVYKTTDGGATWNNTLFISDSSGIAEMVVHPTNPNIMYASSYNRLNLPIRGISKGPDAHIYKSIDGGSSWTQLTNGLPSTDHSRVGITISASNPNKLMAVYVNTSYYLDEIYESNDAGATWTGINVLSGTNGMNQNLLGGFGWYFGTIFINPFDENHIVVQGVDQYASYDGGISWSLNVPEWWTYEVHADKHALYFQDINTMVLATDGSIYKTSDQGANWDPLGSLPISQFYRVTAETFTNGLYAGGLQDNGTVGGNILATEWIREFGGDGFKVTYIDPSDHSTVYETQRGGMYWVDDNNGQNSISINNSLPGENTNWNTPYVVLPDNSIIAGSHRILKMDNPPFDSWAPLTTDITMIGLGATTPDKYHTITELDYNPNNPNEIVAGTSDGLVWIGNIQTSVWDNIKGTLPDNYVSAVRYSKITPDKLYLTMTGYYNNFSQALVYKSEDGGQTWIDISSNLPAIGVNDIHTYSIDQIEALFLGTDAGVFMSLNDGTTWELLGTGLPIVTVSELDIDEQNERLIAGTFGRSMWSYDLSWALVNGLPEIIAYPNPTSDYIQFKTDIENLRVYTVDGKVVMELKNIQAYTTIDITGLESGNYIIVADNSSANLVVE